MFKISIHFIIFVIVVIQTNGQDFSINDIIPPGYNPKSTPNASGVTNVNMTVIVNDLIGVTETASSFTLDITFKLKWFDNRLNLSSLIKEEIENTSNTIDNIILDSSFVPKFWIPDIYFQNALSASVVNSGLPIQYLVIGINNNITYTVRLSATFICLMDLSAYPQDYQYCSLEAVSLTQTRDELMLFWEGFEAGIQDTPKFRIRKSFTGDCTRRSYSGNFSCRSATLKLVRRVSYYMIRVYAPTFLSVCISFVGFWIPPLGFPARVIVNVNPILNLITQDIGLNNDIGVAYTVAIHWWMIWCQVFIYLALIEYATAISWAHFINEKKAIRAQPQVDSNDNKMSRPPGHYFGNKNVFEKIGRIIDKILYFFFGNVDFQKDPMTRNKVDYCARIIYPFMWIVYCLLFIFATICPWAANYNV